MDKFIVIFALALAFVCAKINPNQFVCFHKSDGESNVFNFSYKLYNGKTFLGETIFIHTFLNQPLDSIQSIHFLIDDDGSIHWISFYEDEINSTELQLKKVLPVDRRNDSMKFRDDFHRFALEIYNGEVSLNIMPITVVWDTDHVCFAKVNDGQNLFLFEVKSLNTQRRVTGITYFEDGNTNPLVQSINIEDEYVLEVEFTEEEFNRNETFCRNTTTISVPLGVRGGGWTQNIDPNALKSLVG